MLHQAGLQEAPPDAKEALVADSAREPDPEDVVIHPAGKAVAGGGKGRVEKRRQPREDHRLDQAIRRYARTMFCGSHTGSIQ
jgi:hypothetical protein